MRRSLTILLTLSIVALGLVAPRQRITPNHASR